MRKPKPIDMAAALKASKDYALEKFKTTEFHLGDFDKAAPVVVVELAKAWAVGFMAGRESA